jgi:hypothetical protein
MRPATSAMMEAGVVAGMNAANHTRWTRFGKADAGTVGPRGRNSQRSLPVVAKVAPLGILQRYATPEQQVAEIREELRRPGDMFRKAGLTE